MGKAADKTLVIVESPTKARTIRRILGDEHKVMASMGHVRDLPAKQFGVDIENGFAPEYVLTDRKGVLAPLKKAAGKAALIYLAPDPDREGEAIAWHLQEALKLPARKVRRVTFHEITTRAVKKAFEAAGSLDMNKVNAQQARRILDRLVGYKISPLLWKRITKGLSAGRVQSVALKLVVEREKEIEAFVPREYWRITAVFAGPAGFEATGELVRHPLSANCPRCGKPLAAAGKRALACPACGAAFRPDREYMLEPLNLPDQAAAEAVIAAVSGKPFVVSKFTASETRGKPLPPFNTSLLQQLANVLLGFSATRTMRIAQSLYEGIELAGGRSVGLITYMRTDSLRCAPAAMAAARKYIGKTLGAEYVPAKPPYFRARRGAQEAHEAIRPTEASRSPEQLKKYLDNDQYRLYDLIWRRFLASQTSPARYSDSYAELVAGDYVFVGKGRSVLFEGANRFWPPSGKSQQMPALTEGAELRAASVEPSQHFTQPPPRYTEASLVRTLEREGIGRPSTYATIISTLTKRGYALKSRRQFRPTELGRLVSDKLVRHFPEVMDVGFTAHMEEELDDIEEARRDWQQVLSGFWGRFRESLERAGRQMRSEKEEEHPDEKCPECGGAMLVRYSRRGKFLGCKRFPACKGSKRLTAAGDERPASTPLGENCPQCGNGLLLRHSRRGPFVGCSGFPNCRYTRALDEEDQPATGEEAAELEA